MLFRSSSVGGMLARLQQANIPPTDDQLKYAVTIQESDVAGIGAKYG